MSSLPIDAVLPALRDALREHSSVVVHAPTGAGKTTRVPLALLDAPWREHRRIIMLEPRRVAARAAAQFMARERGETVGQTVGYRTRFDTQVSRATRIEVVTEGVLTQLVQRDPELADVAAIIFDEFHERSLQADLGLALSLDVQAALRPDLRLIVMSATLASERVAAFLGDAPVITSQGRRYPVDIQYIAARAQHTMVDSVVAACERALQAHDGAVLAFLPGAREIQRATRMLRTRLADTILIAPLYAALPSAEIDRALQPAPHGQQKVVLATNIAETSLTIADVRAVVDGGQVRAPRFDPASGMTHLITTSIARDAADQRAGRAGRVAAGTCYRLWSRAVDRRLPATTPPEITHADLAPLLLSVARWGVTDITTLRWLNPPPSAACAQARDVLIALDALTEAGQLTAHGRHMSALPTHPRLAHMIVRAQQVELAGVACVMAALLSEADVAARATRDGDAHTRFEIITGQRKGGVRARVARVRQAATQLATRAGVAQKITTLRARPTQIGLLLAWAYPDRIAQRRTTGDGCYLLANGRGAELDTAFASTHAALANASWLGVARVERHHRATRISLAAPIDAADIDTHFSASIHTKDTVCWDGTHGGVRQKTVRRLGAIVLEETPTPHADSAHILEAMLDGIRETGLDCLPWTPALTQWRTRVMYLRRHNSDWPCVDDAALYAQLPQWLGPYLAGVSRLGQLAQLPLRHALEGLLSSTQRTALERLAPCYFMAPTGSRIKIDYTGETASIAVRVQEMFGCLDTPTIMDGAQPLTIQLLSPAHRPVQITNDLVGFWQNSYRDVQKDMKGRYPKHPWPDDPAHAAPTRRTKRSR